MRILAFKIESYTAFRSTGWVELSRGINVFAGQNNSGKSALLRALSLNFVSNPFRDPDYFSPTDAAPSQVSIRISAKPSEIWAKLKSNNKNVIFPYGNGAMPFKSWLDNALNNDLEIVLEGVSSNGGRLNPIGGSSIKELQSGQNLRTVHIGMKDGNFTVVSGGGSENILEIYSKGQQGSTFYFAPERLNVSRHQFGTAERLNSDASNLPVVLAFLQGSRRDIFDRIEQHLVELVPGIARITVTPDTEGFSVLIWPDDKTDRRELAFSLEDSGTGVGQLLSILTAVASSEQSVILIDEINTFLHPAASKKLISILRSEYGQHQYLITTHSSDVLASTVSEGVFLVKRSGSESTIEPVNLTDFRASRDVAGHLGFSMMDVFGHDRLIWVEGQTEELCFPYIFRKREVDFSGVGIVAVASTAEFSNRGASRKSIVNLYDRVAQTAAPLLKGMAFGLDREDLSVEAAKKLERSKRKLKFLPRRSLENFLVNPVVISDLLVRLGEGQATVKVVEEWLLANGGDREFSAASVWKSNLVGTEWLARVDAAKLLQKLFSELTENRFEYRKTTHTLELLKLAIEHDHDLTELFDFADSLLETAHKDTKP